MLRKSNLNFVWIGPPKVQEGGQDVVGIYSICKNHTEFKTPEENRNSLHFWCQFDYIETYHSYFIAKGFKVILHSIEDYLNKLITNKDEDGIKVKDIFNELIMDPHRNKIVDRVYFKDLFFLVLLSKEGGYCLDTNIQALQTAPVNFKEYPKYHFPILNKKIFEVWMQYCPEKDKPRALASLHYYLEKHLLTKEIFAKFSYAKPYHDRIGNAIVAAVTLGRKEVKLDLTQTWQFEHTLNSNVTMPEFNLFKEYYNSHRKYRENNYLKFHDHIAFGKRNALQFSLEHGINPNAKINTQIENKNRILVKKNEALINIAFFAIFNKNGLDCAKLLLEKKADIDNIYLYSKDNKSFIERSVLTDAINNKSNEGLNLALQYGAKVSLILNNQSPLLLAIQFNFGIEVLLKNKADPNQRWQGQTHTPLLLAVIKNNIEAIKLLLNYKATPNMTGGRYQDLEKTIVSIAPLHIALEKNYIEIVELLLLHGANPNICFEYKINKTNYVSTAYQIKTSDECKKLLDNERQSKIINSSFFATPIKIAKLPLPLDSALSSILPLREEPYNKKFKFQ